MATQYYFISDMHIGGEGPLDECEFQNELIDFLKMLENEPGDTELIIVGDAFGLWEFTEIQGAEKLRTIVRSHLALFEQFRRTGAKIRITLIPGNHDYDLACDPEYIPLLKEYGITLEPKIAITREILGRRIWIEHGSQHDETNSFPDFGNPHAVPFGWFVVDSVVSRAGKSSDYGRGNWLKDIQSVHPMEALPHWVFSNYIYREMAPMFRYALLPIAVILTPLAVLVAGFNAEEYGLISTTFFTDLGNYLLNIGGLFGGVVSSFILINAWIITIAALAVIPGYLIYRDIKQTLLRYGIQKPSELVGHKGQHYVEAARKVFMEDPGVAAFIYGHTHAPSLTKEGDHYIINTGSWLKRLHTVRARLRFMPDVYWPSFEMSYFKIHAVDGRIAIDYNVWPIEAKLKLTPVERILTFGRPKTDEIDIPERVYLDPPDEAMRDSPAPA